MLNILQYVIYDKKKSPLVIFNKIHTIVIDRVQFLILGKSYWPEHNDFGQFAYLTFTAIGLAHCHVQHFLKSKRTAFFILLNNITMLT